MYHASKKKKKKAKRGKSAHPVQRQTTYPDISTHDALTNLQSPESIMHLQRTIGNQATQQLLAQNAQQNANSDLIQKKGTGATSANATKDKIMSLVRDSNERRINALDITDDAKPLNKALKKHDEMLTKWDAYYKGLAKLQVKNQNADVQAAVIFAQKAREKLVKNKEDIKTHLDTVQQLPPGLATNGMKQVNRDKFKGDWKKDVKKVRDSTVEQVKKGKEAKQRIIKPAKKIVGGIQTLSEGDGAQMYADATGAMATTAAQEITGFINKYALKFAFKLIMAGKKMKDAYGNRKKWATANKAAKDRVKKAGPSGATQEDSTVYESVKYALRKATRRLLMKIHDFAMALAKTISRIVSVASGGTSALVTESIVLATTIEQKAVKLAMTLKGLYKWLQNTRGQNRKFNSAQLLSAALAGDDVALDLMINMNVYEGFEDAKASEAIKGSFGDAVTGQDKQKFKQGMSQVKAEAKRRGKRAVKSLPGQNAPKVGPQTRPNMLVWLAGLSKDDKKIVRKLLEAKMKSK